MSRMVRHYVFTINNPSFAPEALPLVRDERYVSWQLEKGENGTLHIQGYIELIKSVRFTHVKKFLVGAHVEPRQGTRDQARDYTRKEESRQAGPFERGTWDLGGQGHRSDLDAAVEALKEGGMKRVAQEHPTAYVKFSRGLRELQAELEEPPRDLDFQPKPWQQYLLDHLSQDPDDREIIWVTDTRGNTGKSRLARHLIMEHGAVQLSGRILDMAYLYNKEPIVIFDVTRAAADHTDHLYTVAENLKNGVIVSTKYDCRQKMFKPPHVIFFANFSWNRDKWSHDRVLEIDLCNPDYNV